MRNTAFIALVVALAMLSSVGQAAAENTPPVAPKLTVRVYDTTRMPAADQTVALRAAAGVLTAAGIDSTWVTCGADAAWGVCETPLGPTELSVRFARLPAEPSSRGMLQLGYSLVNTRAGEGKLATLFVDRVESLAAQSGAQPATLLGLAVAHEIGHLLLGTNAHAPSGLMRAAWSRRELQRAHAADWVFSRAEAARMRSSLAERNVLRSAERDSNASGCSASDGDTDGNAAGCHSAAAAAALRAVAAGAD